MSIRDRLSPPPSTVTGELGVWMGDLWKLVNGMPVLSYFSGTDPNSSVTGMVGDLAVNIGAASTSSRLWVKGGSASVSDQSNWAQVKVMP